MLSALRGALAAYTTARSSSSRAGRTAAGKGINETAITAAAIRHTHTRYDELLMSILSRVDARDAVDRTLESWRKPVRLASNEIP